MCNKPKKPFRFVACPITFEVKALKEHARAYMYIKLSTGHFMSILADSEDHKKLYEFMVNNLDTHVPLELSKLVPFWVGLHLPTPVTLVFWRGINEETPYPVIRIGSDG